MAGERIRIKRAPFNHRWPDRSFSVIREVGTFPVGYGVGEVHPDMAEAAITGGYAQRIKARGRRKATTGAQSASQDGDAADTRQPDRVDREDMAAPDRADRGPPLDDAG